MKWWPRPSVGPNVPAPRGLSGLGGEFPQEGIGAHVPGILLHGGPVGQTGQKVTDGPAHPLFFDAQDRPLRNQMRMKVVKFKQPLEDLAGALVDLLDVGVLVKIFAEEVAEILDLHPHGQGEGDEPAAEGAGIRGGSRAGFLEIDSGLPDLS